MALSPVRGRGLMKEECSKDLGSSCSTCGCVEEPSGYGVVLQNPRVPGHLPKNLGFGTPSKIPRVVGQPT